MENTKYKIATENNVVGHANNNLQAAINLGLKKGYGGFTQEKQEVLDFLTEQYKASLSKGDKFLPFVITDAVITYAYPSEDGYVGAHEPSLVLTTDKSPLYAADLPEKEWQNLVEHYASLLGNKFQQYRVYVTYTRVETKIFQQA